MEPQRDIVVRALDNAAAAGVVPVVAAGNDFEVAGLRLDRLARRTRLRRSRSQRRRGGGDGHAPDVVAVVLVLRPDAGLAAAEARRDGPRRRRPLLGPAERLGRRGTGRAWRRRTSRAARRFCSSAIRPGRCEQVKSALASTGDPVHPAGGPAGSRRCGRAEAASISPAPTSRCSSPIPTSLGWGLVRRGFSGTTQLVDRRTPAAAARPGACPSTPQSMPRGRDADAARDEPSSPGQVLSLRLRVSRTARAGRRDGLRRPHARQRRAPGCVLVPRRGAAARARPAADAAQARASTAETRPGSRRACPRIAIPERGARAGRAHAARWAGAGLPVHAAANRSRTSASSILGHARGVHVSPRLVADADENRARRLHGDPGEPEPVRRRSAGAEPVVGAVLPDPGDYDFVFDTPTRREAGRVHASASGSTTPRRPSIRLLARTTLVGRPIRLAVRDSGSGVDPLSLARHGGRRPCPIHVLARHALDPDDGLRPGRTHVVVTASDYQETKNMEDVGPGPPEHAGSRARP